MIDKHFKFEEKVIDVILGLIRDNQEYLTKPENLPQLAKLGFIYNTLWYAGRKCWGHHGILRDGAKKTSTAEEREDYGLAEGEDMDYNDCEDNPKYKIEMCNPDDEEIEDLIYDAWAMHVSDKNFNFMDFVNLIKEGKELNDFDIKMLKINKTFDEWVEVLTDPQYTYTYDNRRDVADTLLCTVGTEYSLNKDGFIIRTAGGADQDMALYGDWENSKLREDIKNVIYDILDIPEVKATLDENYKIRKKYLDAEEAKEQLLESKFYSSLKLAGLYDETEGKLSWNEIHNRLDKIWTKDEAEIVDNYNPYYPISSYSSIYAIISQETRDNLGITTIDESYINEAIRICQEILAHEDEECEGNKEFAKKLLLSQGFTEYAQQG